MGASKVKSEEVRIRNLEMYRLWKEGLSMEAIAWDFKVSATIVGRIMSKMLQERGMKRKKGWHPIDER